MGLTAIEKGMIAPGARAGRLVVVTAADRSDEQLLELVAVQRDAEAFDELYARYARALFAVVRRSLGEQGRSEDVVQEAFANVWRAASGYRRERGSAAGWLYAIARNAAADALRQRRAVSFGEPPDQADPAPGPEDVAASDFEAFKVHAAVDALPPRERDVIELAYFDGLSQREVADRLDVPLGTVKTRTRSGLARLAERLSEERVLR
jgi:RNA polymerase sigma-70 factor (ECF subfamily)